MSNTVEFEANTSSVELKSMRVFQSIAVTAALLLSHSSVTMATAIDNPIVISQSSVIVNTDDDGGQIQSTSISLDRADLTQPHLLRVRGSTNNTPIPMQRVEVKINGKVVKTIANKSLELNLAPMMKAGRYEVEISGTSPRLDDTISVNFTGKNTNVTQQFSGTGSIDQKLVIDVR
ncbi:hypothetical protein [Chamaesiphon sp.]|uniref:hypothetical protein n=1 Tax=Chamaesiphon sp. TaxID=2814140 RepID=UPI0035934392